MNLLPLLSGLFEATSHVILGMRAVISTRYRAAHQKTLGNTHIDHMMFAYFTSIEGGGTIRTVVQIMGSLNLDAAQCNWKRYQHGEPFGYGGNGHTCAFAYQRRLLGIRTLSLVYYWIYAYYTVRGRPE